MRLTIAMVLARAATLVVGAHITSPAVVDASPERPANFVYRQSCPAPFADPSVGFAIPGVRDLPALNADGAEQIWIDLSIFDNGFAPGTFIGAGPFFVGIAAEVPRYGALEFQWDGLDRAFLHYYRLNALRDGRWIELGRGVFEPINCGVVEAMECAIGDPAGVLSVQFGIAEPFSTSVQRAIEQWFDLTIIANPRSPMLDNGFLPGTYIGAGPFSVGGTHYTWQGIRPGLRHFYRNNVLYDVLLADDHRWMQTYSGSFLSLDCRGLPAFDAPG
jgi:hypothetical protein